MSRPSDSFGREHPLCDPFSDHLNAPASIVRESFSSQPVGIISHNLYYAVNFCRSLFRITEETFHESVPTKLMNLVAWPSSS